MTPKQAVQLGRTIAAARIKRGLSYRQLEDVSGMPTTWLFKLERGQMVNPDPSRLARLAEELNIPPERINRLTSNQVSEALPGMRTYFRAKYDLTQAEIDDIERYVQKIRRNGGRDAADRA